MKTAFVCQVNPETEVRNECNGVIRAPAAVEEVCL